MFRKNQNGAIGILELVAILGVLALIGFVVWRVTSVRTETENASFETGQTEETESTDETDDQTATGENGSSDGWTEYENSKFGLSFSYPEKWGNVRVEDRVEKCSQQNNINGSKPGDYQIKVTGGKYKISFSEMNENGNQKSIDFKTSNFKQVGVLPCLYSDPFDYELAVKEAANTNSAMPFVTNSLAVLVHPFCYEGCFNEYRKTAYLKDNSLDYDGLVVELGSKKNPSQPDSIMNTDKNFAESIKVTSQEKRFLRSIKMQ